MKPNGGISHFNMTLRDWFAGQAIRQMPEYSNGNSPLLWPDKAAKCAYAVADAMIAERTKNDTE